MNSRRLRAAAGAMAIGLTSLVMIALAGLPVFVYPQTDPPTPADAIVVLGGTAYERFDVGLALAERGYAPRLVISRSTGLDDPVMDRYCAREFRFAVECFVPDPWTTRGEAREIGRLADRYGWHHIIVVTFTPHVSRARYIVGRCFSGDISMVASPSDTGPEFWSWMYIRQSAGYLRAFAERGC